MMKKHGLTSESQTPRLVQLNREDLHLEDLGSLIHYPSGAFLNHPGAVPDYCYYLKRGRVICCEITDSGDQQVYAYMDPGTLLLEEYLLFDRPAPVLFKTMVECDLIKIDASTIKAAYQRNFQVLSEICENLSDKLVSSVNTTRMGSRHNAAWKICRMLLFYAQNYGQLTEDNRICIDQSLSQQKLADILGMNRVTVTKKIKELKDIGLIEVQSRHFYLPDVDRIVDYMLEIEDGE